MAALVQQDGLLHPVREARLEEIELQGLGESDGVQPRVLFPFLHEIFPILDFPTEHRSGASAP